MELSQQGVGVGASPRVGARGTHMLLHLRLTPRHEVYQMAATFIASPGPGLGRRWVLPDPFYNMALYV